MDAKSITEVDADCPECEWLGTVADCESGEDGELECPKCGTTIVIGCA